jgi:superfamily I DNA/RNA helicase
MILEQVLDRLVRDPLRVGFTSFTRAARREASSRAAQKFNVSLSSLEKEGYFRTLHSVCYKQLGIQSGELLVGTAEDNEWIKKALGDEQVHLSRRDDDDDYLGLSTGYSDSGQALMLWDIARNRQVPLEHVWIRVQSTNEHLPDLEACKAIASLYEAKKREDGRLDFCDLLLRFAGRRFSGNHDAPWDEVEPQGENPHLPVWFHDEMNDCSQLTSLVFRRLVETSSWVYLAGDPCQAIYGWCGSDGSIFSRWEVSKEEELPISYRCDQKILDYAYRCIVRNPNLPAGRASFQSASGEPGVIDHIYLDEALAQVCPGQDVLVLTRTRDYAAQAALYLDENLIPWIPTNAAAHGPRCAPARLAGIRAILDLRAGREINGIAFWRLLAILPSKIEGTELFIRGTKKFFDDESERKQHPPISLSGLAVAGGTNALKELIGSGSYVNLLEKPAAKLALAAQRHGIEAVETPTVKVGTMHSAKGMGADHVIALNRIPLPVQRGILDAETLAEERRLWYVTASRARHRLTITEDGGDTFEEIEEIEAE